MYTHKDENDNNFENSLKAMRKIITLSNDLRLLVTFFYLT